ncbi:MAG: hypothetical protein AAGJ83_05810 [Planctomycetota bacterium]
MALLLTVNQIIEANEQLILLSNLGLPIDLGLGDSKGASNAIRLTEINQFLKSRGGKGQEEPDWTSLGVGEEYRRKVSLLVHSGIAPSMLESYGMQANRLQGTMRMLQKCASEPLLLLSLGFLGLVAYCVFTVPNLETQLQPFQMEPGTVTAGMIALRHWLPIWVIVTPLTSLLIHRVWKSYLAAWIAKRLVARNRQRGVAQEFAELTSLLEAGLSVDEALALVHPAELETFRRALMPPVQDDENSNEGVADSELPSGVASTHSLQLESLRSCVQLRDTVMQETLETKWSSIRFWIALSFAGIITLLYALVMFLPLVEMLQGFARQGT